ncbi:MAG: cobalamin B12-binding domain-containing protein [archaeon]|nr:cobalamin B12-binding domain-containing protein [archaeon]
MKVLLLKCPSPHPPWVHVKAFFPLGLASIAAVLEANDVRVKLIDALALHLNWKKIESIVSKYKPDIVGVTCFTQDVPNVAHLAKMVKSIAPECTVIAGGPHPSLCSEDLLRRTAIDIAVIGEGEYTMLDLVNALEKNGDLTKILGIAFKDKDGKIIKTSPRPPISNLDSLPFAARHHLPPQLYSVLGKPYPVTMICSRGCPYNCVFCSIPKIHGHKHRARSVENVIREIEFLMQNYHAKSIDFKDDNFTLDMGWTKTLCDEIIKRGLDINWMCLTRVDCVNKGLLQAMKKSGCTSISYGVESGSQEVLNRAKKGITVEQIRNAVKWTKEAGIEVFSWFMFGLPGENKETIQQTIKFAKDLDPDYAYFFIASPLPGTELFDLAVKEGIISEIDYLETRYSAPHPQFVPEGLTGKDLTAAVKLARLCFYLRPNFVLRTIRKMASPGYNWSVLFY